MDWVEIIAAVLGLVGIGLQIKQSHWYWLTSILMVLLYIYVFYQAKFYADMSFQVYYLIISIYGWYLWLTKRETDESKLTVNRLSSKSLSISIIVSAILFGIIYLVLKRFTDSPIPIGDAFTTALSITATWLLAKKYIENWIFWIVVDAVSTILYIYKGLYPSAILFTVLTVLAFVGFFKWRKEDLKHA